MKKIGIQAVDEAIKYGVDLDGTPIPPKNTWALQQDYEWRKQKRKKRS